MAEGTIQAFPALDFLKIMLVCREGDRREGLLLRQNRGWFHVAATGHEALGVLAYALNEDDYLYLYYRDRAIALTRGMTTRDLALAYFARAASASAGRMMPSHYSSRPHNVFSVATPTGSQCLPAAGTAWAFKLAGKPNVALCTIGDAATRQGEFFEAVAFALQECLPVVFVVEDNGYGISTPTARLNPYTIEALSASHVVQVNGRDPVDVYARGNEAVRKARTGGGPAVLWCDVDRISSHTCSDDHRVYRSTDELDQANLRDPIPHFADRLMREGLLSENAYQEMQETARRSVDEDYQAAEAADLPEISRVRERVLGPPPAPVTPPALAGENPAMVGAVNQTLRAALAEDRRVVVFGEDVEDPKGGVFGLTKGLSTAFPGRVCNSPLAEATIVGTAVGMAVAGYMPVFELQFIDFLPPAMNQLMSQVSCLRWRSNGEWKCPMVLMAPYGAYLPGGGVWHSESKEGLLAHIPGIQVAIPSTPGDAAGLLWTAIHGEDPVLFLLAKHLFRQHMATPDTPEPIPFGKAAVRREGDDVTLVSWGNCVELCEAAAAELDGQGVSAEVVDLRTIVPCDWDAIEKSLAKTGRLVVVHEDNRTCGFGESIVSQACATPGRWDLFLAPPQLVARADTPVPFNPSLEYEVLPDVPRVVAAVQATME